MLAAFVKAPLTSILLLFEITRDYNVLIPVMAGVSASMFTQAELTKLLAPAVPAGTPKWLSLNDGAMLESTLTSQAMVTDFVLISVDTPLLGAARAIADAQAAQALSTCYGIVLEGKDGEVLGSATLRQVMNEVADVIKPLQIAFSQFDVDSSGEVRDQSVLASAATFECGVGVGVRVIRRLTGETVNALGRAADRSGGDERLAEENRLHRQRREDAEPL